MTLNEDYLWNSVLLKIFCLGIYPLLYILFGEGNGTPLQYSCLESPMDGGA